jgi:hypothetical protein
MVLLQFAMSNERAISDQQMELSERTPSPNSQ